MSPNLAGLHDIESTAIAPPDTWLLDTVALSENPAPRSYPANLSIIARLNYGYGSTGTLPNANDYNAFAAKVAAFVAGSHNCRRWIVGNEPNLRREWPNGAPIYPWHYAACFKLCRDAIHAIPGHQNDEVLIAAPGPWNDECKYEGNPKGDWITYFEDVLILLEGELDGFSLHAYTHGYNVALVTDTSRMETFPNRYYNFRTYMDYCFAIPDDYHQLPAYITEANGNGPWQAVGLMPAMLGEIEAWNRGIGLPKIHCVIFYRYPHYDDFYIEGRADVIAEYNGAVARGYMSPTFSVPIPEPAPEPQPPAPQPPTSARDIDPRLYERGVHFEFVEPPAGAWYWRIKSAKWLDVQEAIDVGPDHHILGTIIAEGKPAADVRLLVRWPSGETNVISKAPQPGIPYNYDYPMSGSLHEYSIRVNDNFPTDAAYGIGMGKDGNKNMHTSTWIDWEFVKATEPGPTPPDPQPEPPTPMPEHTEYVIAIAGANLRAAPVSGAILVAVAYGEAVQVDGQQVASDGYMWKDASYFGQLGWIRGDLLSINPPTPLPPEPTGALVHPLPGSVITQDMYQNPANYAGFDMPGHDGTDFGAKPLGTPIRCLADGVVVRAAFDAPGYGNFVEVAHDALGATSVYAHASKLLVAVGEVVAAGQTIALLGSTGNSTGVHLHLSVRLINKDGSYKAGTPMAKGRVDARTFCILHGLKL